MKTAPYFSILISILMTDFIITMSHTEVHSMRTQIFANELIARNQ